MGRADKGGTSRAHPELDEGRGFRRLPYSYLYPAAQKIRHTRTT